MKVKKLQQKPASPRKIALTTTHIFRKLQKGYTILQEKQRLAQLEKLGRGGIYPYPYPYPYPVPQQAAPAAEEKPVDGFEIPHTPSTTGPVLVEEDKKAREATNLSYGLPGAVTGEGGIVARANILWQAQTNQMIYRVIEPPLTAEDGQIIEQIKKELEERLDVDFVKLGMIKAQELLQDQVRALLGSIAGMSPQNRDVILYYISRDIMGYGEIDAFMNDPNIEDISCDGVNIPIYIYHRDPTLGSMPSNVMFTDAEELNSFVVRLAQKAKKTISVADPLLDASLPDGSRIQATLATDIARKGSNFTIRKFTKLPLTPVHLLRYGTLSAMEVAYLWMAVENGRSILISGGTATGKTSALNALSLFIRQNLKVVSIEDTPELRLPHPHWIPHVARTPLSIKGEVGEVTLFDLLKASLRQRPDYIIAGEVRGKEAFVLFQQMASIPGDEQVFILNDHCLKRIPISAVDPARTVGVPTFNPETGTIEIGEFREKVVHSPVTELYKITTRTGREVVTTGNHSVFDQKGEAETVSELKPGDAILIPARLPCGYNDIDHLNLLGLPNIRVYAPDLIRKARRRLGFDKASQIAGRTAISNYYGANNCALPVNSFLELMEAADISYPLDDVHVRFERRSTVMPATLKVTPELLRLIGYHISEGSLNRARKNNSISLYNNNNEILNDIRQCIQTVSGKQPKERTTAGFGTCRELSFHNNILFEFLKEQGGAKSENRKIPDFVFGLSKEKIGQVLSGLYAGDAHMSGKYFAYYTISRQLANDVALLLLTLGIVATIRQRRRTGRKHSDYEIIFYRRKDMDIFLRYVKPRGKAVALTKRGRNFPDQEVYVDTIRAIEKQELSAPVPVYDLSVPGTQNFIGGLGGILLHNTGHPSLATIHAASLPQLVDRLITPPISLPPTLLENVDIVVFLTLSRLRGRYVRRADTITEIIGVKNKEPVTNDVFKWRPLTDTVDVTSKSVVLKTIGHRQGITEETVREELLKRQKVLEWMLDQQIFEYMDVAKVIAAYYASPDRVVKAAKG